MFLTYDNTDSLMDGPFGSSVIGPRGSLLLNNPNETFGHTMRPGSLGSFVTGPQGGAETNGGE